MSLDVLETPQFMDHTTKRNCNEHAKLLLSHREGTSNKKNCLTVQADNPISYIFTCGTKRRPEKRLTHYQNIFRRHRVHSTANERCAPDKDILNTENCLLKAKQQVQQHLPTRITVRAMHHYLPTVYHVPPGTYSAYIILLASARAFVCLNFRIKSREE